MTNNPSITDIVQVLERRVRQELNDRLPRRVGVVAVNHFNQNFRDSGWRDNGLHPWPETLRQREGEGADAQRGPLIGPAPHLSRSTEARPSPGMVRIVNPVPYAALHNEGGSITTHPTITPRMRRYAWARMYKALGIKKGDKMPKDIPEAARRWKALALTKKSKLTINAKIPRRQFVGDSAELRKKVDTLILQTLERISRL